MARLKEIYIKSAQPYERGRQHGAQAREEILRAKGGYERTFERKGYTWDEVVEMSLEYVPFLEREMPQLMEEALSLIHIFRNKDSVKNVSVLYLIEL